LLALHAFVFSILCQPAPAAPAAPVDVYRLGREVMLLAQLAPLHLSEQQVKAMLGIYRDAGRLAQSNSAVVGELQQVKQQLLAGREVTAKDVQRVLATLPVETRRSGRAAPNETVDKVVAVLDEWQQAIIANRSETLLQILARKGKPPVEETARALLRISGVSRQDWPAEKAHLADRIAAAVDEKQRTQLRAAMLDFLERVHGMSETEIRSHAAELWQDISALVPVELPVLSLLQPIDAESLRRRAAPLVLDPLTPMLLQEVATARGWHVE
jgi:hypothetical protein